MTEPADQPAAGVTYLLVDGENLDAVLGHSVLGRKPAPDERPRWERVISFAQGLWGRPVKGLFFINASSGEVPKSFMQALQASGFRPVPLAGPPTMKVVDVGIQRTLTAIARRSGDVMLASHDGDFLDEMSALLGGDRRVAILAFPEFVNSGYTALGASGLQIFDLEEDARCFNLVLPRVRIIHIDAFDPERFL